MAKTPSKKSLKLINSDQVIDLISQALDLNASPITTVREYCDAHEYQWGVREKTIVKECYEILNK